MIKCHSQCAATVRPQPRRQVNPVGRVMQSPGLHREGTLPVRRQRGRLVVDGQHGCLLYRVCFRIQWLGVPHCHVHRSFNHCTFRKTNPGVVEPKTRNYTSVHMDNDVGCTRGGVGAGSYKATMWNIAHHFGHSSVLSHQQCAVLALCRPSTHSMPGHWGEGQDLFAHERVRLVILGLTH